MNKKNDNIRSESYYPDSAYYLDQITLKRRRPEDQISNNSKFEWPNSYWFIAKELMKTCHDWLHGCHN